MSTASRFSSEVAANVEFLGDRARQLADQEIERARALDTKAGGIVAGSIALIAAGAGFAAKIDDLAAGSGAKTLWAAELALTLVLLLLAGAFAVWALTPRAYRTVVAAHELLRWVTRAVLEQDPTNVRGSLLHADVRSVGHARDVNNLKARRMRYGFRCFAAALACIVALGVSVAVRATSTDGTNSAPRARTVRGRHVGAGPAAGGRSGRAHVPASRSRHRPSRGASRHRTP